VNGEKTVVEDLNKGWIGAWEGVETGATGKLLVRLTELAIKMKRVGHEGYG